MSQPITRYPLATPNGNYIPKDFLKYIGVIRKDFTAAATAVDNLPAGTEVIEVSANAICHIKFANAVAVLPVSAAASLMVADQVRVLANVSMLIAVPSLKYSIIGEAGAGICYIHVLTKWNALALDVQFQRT